MYRQSTESVQFLFFAFRDPSCYMTGIDVGLRACKDYYSASTTSTSRSKLSKSCCFDVLSGFHPSDLSFTA